MIPKELFLWGELMWNGKFDVACVTCSRCGQGLQEWWWRQCCLCEMRW